MTTGSDVRKLPKLHFHHRGNLKIQRLQDNLVSPFMKLCNPPGFLGYNLSSWNTGRGTKEKCVNAVRSFFHSDPISPTCYCIMKSFRNRYAIADSRTISYHVQSCAITHKTRNIPEDTIDILADDLVCLHTSGRLTNETGPLSAIDLNTLKTASEMLKTVSESIKAASDR